MSTNPEVVIRHRARELVSQMHGLGWEGPPYDMEVLASMCGYRPRYVEFLDDDQDACISATEMLVNSKKPSVRQRFSIGHEIGHTLFPDFLRQVACGGPQWRRKKRQDSEIEHLCQLAASELLMPYTAFLEASGNRENCIATILELAERFDASVEATAHRAVDLSDERIIAVFATERWKPTEIAQLQQVTLPLSEVTLPPMRMRVTYAAASTAFSSVFLPRDKSLPEESVAYTAWANAAALGGGPRIFRGEEDWSDVGKIGPCLVEAISLPVNGDKPSSVLCLVRPV